ncbi:MAG: polysaccharide deacetylase family protein [Candidatus Kariarchaeaceae archaeon]|jgi:peptidoglycan/xylan/chitin deacetylase (PgdA/CDA1 family)
MIWKDEFKCAVCLTFDFDADISWRNILRRNDITRDNPVVLSLGKYGPRAALPRILRLLEKHDIKGGFFVPGEVAEKYPISVEEINSQGHEIGHHGYSHKNPASCTPEEEKEEFERGSKILEDLVGKKTFGYRAPAADLSEITLDVLASNNQIYDSSMMTDDLPFTHQTNNGPIIELPWKWILDDWVHFGFNYFPKLEYQSGISSHKKVYEIWSDEFEAVYDEELYYMLVMHPQLMGVPSRAKMLEKLIQLMQSKNDVWFATPYEIAKHWKDTKS